MIGISWYKKGLVVGIILLFVNVTVLSIASSKSIFISDENMVDNEIEPIQYDKILTRKHIFPLLFNYYFIENEAIKNIIKNIIIELIFSGDASIDEIQEFVNASGINVERIYLLTYVKTLESSDGSADCYPGNILAHFLGYNSRGSYIRYKSNNQLIFFWHLFIDGHEVSERGGHLLGYFGHVHSAVQYYYPGEYPLFSLDGFAILIFHGISMAIKN